MGEGHLVEVTAGVIGESKVSQADALPLRGRDDTEAVPCRVDFLAVLWNRDVGLVGERMADGAGSIGFSGGCSPVGDIAADGQNRIRDRGLGCRRGAGGFTRRRCADC